MCDVTVNILGLDLMIIVAGLLMNLIQYQQLDNRPLGIVQYQHQLVLMNRLVLQMELYFQVNQTLDVLMDSQVLRVMFVELHQMRHRRQHCLVEQMCAMMVHCGRMVRLIHVCYRNL